MKIKKNIIHLIGIESNEDLENLLYDLSDEKSNKIFN